MIQDLPALKQFSLQHCFREAAKSLGVKYPILRASQIRMDLPNDERFLIPPHQEIKSVRSPNMVFFINPLVDTSSEKGALQCAPKSFEMGPIKPTFKSEVDRYQRIDESIYKERYPIQQIEMYKGETVMLNMYTIHGSSKNLSEEIRWSLITRYEDADSMPFLDGSDEFLDQFDLIDR